MAKGEELGVAQLDVVKFHPGCPLCNTLLARGTLEMQRQTCHNSAPAQGSLYVTMEEGYHLVGPGVLWAWERSEDQATRTEKRAQEAAYASSVRKPSSFRVWCGGLPRMARLQHPPRTPLLLKAARTMRSSSVSASTLGTYLLPAQCCFRCLSMSQPSLFCTETYRSIRV